MTTLRESAQGMVASPAAMTAFAAQLEEVVRELAAGASRERLAALAAEIAQARPLVTQAGGLLAAWQQDLTARGALLAGYDSKGPQMAEPLNRRLLAEF